MIKYCEICHLEISDTDYDDIHRFNRIKYCDECREKVKKQQNKESRQRRQKREKVERKVEKEEQLLEDAKYVRERQQKARALREERSWIRDVPTMEQELRQELRDTKRKLRDAEIRNQQYAADYINLLRRTEKLEEELKQLQQLALVDPEVKKV